MAGKIVMRLTSEMRLIVVDVVRFYWQTNLKERPLYIPLLAEGPSNRQQAVHLSQCGCCLPSNGGLCAYSQVVNVGAGRTNSRGYCVGNTPYIAVPTVPNLVMAGGTQQTDMIYLANTTQVEIRKFLLQIYLQFLKNFVVFKICSVIFTIIF